MATAQFQMGFVAAIMSQNLVGGTCCMQAEMGSLWTTLHVLVTAVTMQQSTAGITHEALRAEAALHIILTSQVCRYQAAHGRHASLEHPPTAASWKLDVMRALYLDIGMTRFVTDSCPWGHRDPGTGLPCKKRGCFARWVSLAALERKCACVGEHQTVHRTVQGGTRHGERRTPVSGAYPRALCIAFAKVIREFIRH